MIIGIDNGNAELKTNHFILPNGITITDMNPQIAIDKILYFNGKYSFLTEKRNPYQRDKTLSEECFLETLHGIAKELIFRGKADSTVKKIDLAVGLPPRHVGKGKNKFQQYFLSHGKDISFQYGGKNFNIHLNSVHVFPQGYAALVTKPDMLKKYKRLFVVDIGGYTVDVFLIKNGQPDLSYCKSYELGTIKLFNTISETINSEYDIILKDYDIQDILQNKNEVPLPPSITDYIKKAANKHINLILRTLREDDIDLKISPAIFVGGGALLFEDFIMHSDSVYMKTFLPDIRANARGYEILTHMLFRFNL